MRYAGDHVTAGVGNFKSNTHHQQEPHEDIQKEDALWKNGYLFWFETKGPA
jgi:hypothetical protein